MQYRYIKEFLPKLQLDKKRYRVKYCPCGKSNKDGKFVPYVDYDTKGYCHSCGETFLPDLPQKEFLFTPKHYTKPKSFIPTKLFNQSLRRYDANNFSKYLIDLFGADITKQLTKTYFIGTSKFWCGATIFWQKDILGKIRTGKLMLYNPTTGKRVKTPYNYFNWAHVVLKLKDFNLQQCFFGEHLLQDKIKPVAIVESEKSAIIASVYLPEFIWLAVGGLSHLNANKCKVLYGRNVTLFPDINGFDKWSEKVKELSHITRFTISDLLELKATDAERKQGLDIADYLIRYNYKEFLTSNKK